MWIRNSEYERLLERLKDLESRHFRVASRVDIIEDRQMMLSIPEHPMQWHAAEKRRVFVADVVRAIVQHLGMRLDVLPERPAQPPMPELVPLPKADKK